MKKSAPESPVNLLVNGGFDAATTAVGWTLVNSTVVISSGACSVTATSAGGHIKQTLSILEPLSTYTIRASVNGAATFQQARIYTTGASKNADTIFATKSATDVSATFLTDTVPTNVVVYLSVVANGEVVIFDDVAVFKGDIAYPYAPSYTAAEHTAVGTSSPHHAPVTLGVGSDTALALSGQELTLADVLTPTEHTAIGSSAPHHAAITLGDHADHFLSLSGQQLTTPNVDANKVLAGPSSGAATAAEYRVLATADIPIDSDTYDASVANVLGTDTDGGFRVDHVDVGSASGATEGQVKAAGAVHFDRAYSSNLASGSTLVMNTAVTVGGGATYHYSAAAAWSTSNGYDIILAGLVGERGTAATVQQLSTHANWAVTVDANHKLNFTNNTGTASVIYASLLRTY